MEANIKFEHYFIDRIHFDMPAFAASGCLNENEDLPENMGMQFQVTIEIDEAGIVGKVFLEVVIRPNTVPDLGNGSGPEFLTMRIMGIFSQREGNRIEREQFRKMCEINGIASLFPFLRSAVADITRISNVSSQIILPLINVPEMMKTMKKGLVAESP